MCFDPENKPPRWRLEVVSATKNIKNENVVKRTLLKEALSYPYQELLNVLISSIGNCNLEAV